MDNSCCGRRKKKHIQYMELLLYIVYTKKTRVFGNLSTSGANVPVYYMFYDRLSI